MALKPIFPPNRADYELLDRISNGFNVFVFRARCIPNQYIVAIKILDLVAIQSRPNNYPHELNLIQNLPRHPNVLKPHCSFEADDGKLWVVMPYMYWGSIQSIISAKFHRGLPPTCIAYIAVRVVRALDAIHRSGLVHRGVKPGNILVSRFGGVMLSDFGVSSWYYQEESRRLQPGAAPVMTRMDGVITPPYWAPPEGMEPDRQYGRRSDIWLLGVTLLEMFHGRPPVTEFPMSNFAMRRILKRFLFDDYYMKMKKAETTTQEEKQCPDSLRNMLQVCLQRAPERRPDANELMNLEFIKESEHRDFEENFLQNLLSDVMRVEERLKAREVPPPVQVDASTGTTCYRRKILEVWRFEQEKVELVPEFKEDRVVVVHQLQQQQQQLPLAEDPHVGYSSGLCDYEMGLALMFCMLYIVIGPQEPRIPAEDADDRAKRRRTEK